MAEAVDILQICLIEYLGIWTNFFGIRDLNWRRFDSSSIYNRVEFLGENCLSSFLKSPCFQTLCSGGSLCPSFSSSGGGNSSERG